VNLTVTSKHFKPILMSDKRYIVMYGSRSSGKSMTQVQKAIIKLESEPNTNIVGIRKTYIKIKDSLYAELVACIEKMGLDEDYYCKVSPIEIHNKRNGNKMVFRGLDDPQSLKGLKNINCMVIDEANEISLDEFLGANLSIRTDKKGAKLQTIITFNPEAHADDNWIEEMFFPQDRKSYEKEDGSHTYIKSRQKDCVLMHSSVLHHNDYASEEYKSGIRDLERFGKTSDKYKIGALGNWGGAVADKVFTNVEYGTEWPNPDHCDKHAWGMDFGFTNDPTALVEFALCRGEIFYRVHMYACRQQSSDIIQRIKDLGIAPHEEIWCDQADPRMINAIYRAGFNALPADKGKGSILSGVNFMQGYKINIINSPDLEKEHKRYIYNKDKEGKNLPTPIDDWNHAWDACRYVTRMTMMKPMIKFGATIM